MIAMRLATMMGLLVYAGSLLAADPSRVFPEGEKPGDSRIGKVRTLNDKDFMLEVPATLEQWKKRRQEVREQVLVANGLWPMPEKTPLNPVIHGKIDRDDYTVEKVFFASHPGHYVTGNLYRPKGREGKLAGVLCPHGHWANGRLYDAGEKAAQALVDQGAEKTIEGARFHIQARCAHLARMGCVVFHYDMVGYADSDAIPHRQGFTDTEAELRLQNFMGLQTWNSIRALDFLLSLPEVDPSRIGVTGASGGGTQTFILCAIDDRPAVAFPAVMVSTAMQGGCICENCTYLRQGTGNIELAGLFAPKPLAMSGADDWTIDIETKGLPELRPSTSSTVPRTGCWPSATPSSSTTTTRCPAS
jgi:dienelactone hydrolase